MQRENQAREVAVARPEPASGSSPWRASCIETRPDARPSSPASGETELTRIAADKEVEAEKRDIAEVVSATPGRGGPHGRRAR
ncbi:flotillin family protein [Streptomyces hirsutus]